MKALLHLSGGNIWCLLVVGTFSLCSVPSSFADSGTGTVLSYTTGTIITPSSPVVAGTRYGRVIRLQYSGSANGTLIATFEAWPNDFGIYQSTDDGLTWKQIATTTETQFPGWQFKVEPDLLEVPSQMGNLPPGTILLAGNSTLLATNPANGNGHQLEIYYSLDHGVAWQYRGMVDNNGTTGLGLWEPRLGVTGAGQLVCYYSDERFAPTYSQLIGERVSPDGGLTWGAEQYACAIPDGVQRPGMAVTAKLRNGRYVMSFEAQPENSGQVHIKFSNDGTNWGSGPADYGIAVQTASGAYLGACPYIMWCSSGGSNGTLVVSAQNLVNSPNADREFLINTNLGQGNWTMIPAAVQWQGGGNTLAGWSQGMIPTWDGQGIIQLASSSVTINSSPDYNQMLFAREQMVLPGTTYTIFNQNSGLAIDIPGNTSVHGTELQQWIVNGGPAQQWTFNDLGNNVWTVINPGNQLAWDDYGWGTVVGTIVDQWDYNGLAVQQWKLKPVGSGAWKFINVNSSLALAVTNASQSPGAGIVLWTNTATSEQNWFPSQPTTTLAAYYALDGNTLDGSGNGNNGTPSASATNYIPGRIGTQALQFNGVDAYVQIPRSIGAGSCFTIAFWIKTTQTGNGGLNWWNGAGLIDGKLAGVVTNDFGVSLLNGAIAFGIGNPDTTLQSTVSVNDGQWHHVAVTRNGFDGTMTIYLDGTVNTNKFGPVGPRTASPFLRLGGLQTGAAGTFYNGALDDVRLYNGWLDTNTIGQLAAMPQMNFPPILAGISNQTLVAGQTLNVTNSATDPNVPPQVLSWSIQPTIAGLTINTNTGVINWRPTIAQSPATNTLNVIVADSGTPSLSATQQFTVTVLRPAAPQLTSPQISEGNFSLVISGNAGPDYTVLASTNLSNWTLLLTTNPAALPFTLYWSVSNNLPNQFYQVQLGP
ncbi:MAG: RICIN domain-containing protein [Verrucomicrobiia bacterium]